MAAGEGHDGTVDATQAREGMEVLEKLDAELAVVESHGGLGELAHERRPQVRAIGSPAAEVDDR
jgi:hypothetical protein